MKCRIIIGIQKGTIILTTTQVYSIQLHGPIGLLYMQSILLFHGLALNQNNTSTMNCARLLTHQGDQLILVIEPMHLNSFLATKRILSFSTLEISWRLEYIPFSIPLQNGKNTCNQGRQSKQL